MSRRLGPSAVGHAAGGTPRGHSRCEAPLRAFQGRRSALNQHIGGQAKTSTGPCPAMTVGHSVRGAQRKPSPSWIKIPGRDKAGPSGARRSERPSCGHSTCRTSGATSRAQIVLPAADRISIRRSQTGRESAPTRLKAICIGSSSVTRSRVGSAYP
jgi:hypothetical protein